MGEGNLHCTITAYNTLPIGEGGPPDLLDAVFTLLVRAVGEDSRAHNVRSYQEKGIVKGWKSPHPRRITSAKSGNTFLMEVERYEKTFFF